MCPWLLQVLQEAKGRLRNEILDRLDAAKKAGDHASVLRFTRLYAPLGLQVECPLRAWSRPVFSHGRKVCFGQRTGRDAQARVRPAFLTPGRPRLPWYSRSAGVAVIMDVQTGDVTSSLQMRTSSPDIALKLSELESCEL